MATAPRISAAPTLEAIRQALASTESCTSTAHSLLNGLFFPSSSKPSDKATLSRITAGKTTKKRATQTVAEADRGLSTLERYIFATEVVNTALKTLNAASKQAQGVGETVKEVVQLELKIKKPTTKTGNQPLKSKSLNRVTPPPASQQHPAMWTAECLCLAIDYIYSVQHSDELPTPPPPLQIETAQHNLIVRLIILKLYDIALRELVLLKKRIDALISGGGKAGIEGLLPGEAGEKENKKPTIAKGVRTKPTESRDDSIASLLTFKSIPPTITIMDLVAGFQMSVMRCIIGMGKPGAAEALVTSLSAPNNTLSLLKSLPNSNPKLAALDSLLFSCCPSVSSSADSIAKTPSPITVLQLQTYALEAKILLKIKNGEEYWELLTKCLAAFCRRCAPNEGGKERYKVVREAVLQFQRAVPGDLPENILQLLSTVAQESGYGSEALKWMEEAHTLLNKKGNVVMQDLNYVAQSMRLIKLATLNLKAYVLTLGSGASSASVTVNVESVMDIGDKTKNAIQSVDALTKVKMEDLEKLLQEVALFRRAATVVAVAPIPPVTQESRNLQAARTELKGVCVSVSEMAIRYFRNYISLQPNYGKRVKKLAAPAVDFITTKVRQEAGNGGQIFLETWESLDKTLNDCLDLINLLVEHESDQKMDTNSEQAKEEEIIKGSEFEKISTAYWKAACALKKLDAQKEGIKAMKRSVTALLGRPKEETLRGGLVAKLERLGNCFYQVGETARAEEAFLEGIKVLQAEGALDEILQLADTACLSDIFGDDRIGMMLGRMLDGIVKCVLKDAPSRRQRNPGWSGIPFDSEILNRETRGLMLEWELRGLCGLGKKDLPMMKAVAERLLELYTDEEPLRRARVIAKMLKLQVDNPNFMAPILAVELGEEVETIGPLHRDVSLKPRRSDIVSSCLVSYAFLNYQATEPRPDILQKALISWRNTIESCNDWDRLLERIEDPEELMAQLYMLVEFLEVKGLSFHRITALRSLVLIRGVEVKINYDALVKLHGLLGIQYLRMGYSGKAGMVLAKANSWIDKDGVWQETRVQWHVAYTEYLVGIGNIEKAKEHYDLATKIVNGETSIFEYRRIGSKLERRVVLNRMIADASYVMSLLCFELGNTNDALCHVRRCIRLNQRSWAVLEQLCRDPTVTTKASYPQLVANIVNPDLQKLIDGVDHLSVSRSSPAQAPIQSMSFAALNAPLLWTLVTSMYLSLVQASLIYRHQGMIREAVFNMEQALKTVEAVDATPLIAQALSIFGDLKIRAGSLSEGADMLERATELRAEIEKSKEIVSLDCTVGYLHGKNRLWEEEWGAYEHAESKLAALMSPGFIKNIDELALAGEVDDEGLKMNVREDNLPEEKAIKRPRTPTGKRAPTVSRTKSAATKPAAVAKDVAKLERGIITECSSLLKMRGNILRLKAYNLAMQSQVDQADLLLEEAGKLPSGQFEIIFQRLAAAKHLLLEALKLLASDPVFCVLQDSTISLPSVAPPKVVTMQVHVEQVPVKDRKKGRKGKAMKEPDMEEAKAFHFVEVLTKARHSVADIHFHAAKVGSTAMVHSVSTLLSGIIVLLSAVTSSKGKGSCNPLLASYSLELTKGLPLLREKDAIETEKITAGEEGLSWPQISPFQDDSFKPVSTPFAFSSFQKDYIDIIPPGWAAVSISLSEAEDELYISRYEAGHGQFMLRLPLTRHNSRDDAEEIFEYGTGIETLKEILEKANISTHAAKEATAGDKATKTEWWAERESLDAQLGELLANIEHCWLGGFKGIFGQYPRHPELLRRFRATFEKILAQHLPSRQPRRTGKKGVMIEVPEPVKIDPRVLDLFIGLGDPTKMNDGMHEDEEKEGMDASLVDLLWFVFDILQFHGERNAYDEIDTDAIVIDVKESVRGYYQHLSYLPKSEQEITQHTILILDKNVHQIPWESLPCLDGHAISRLPSLASLRSILTNKKMDTGQVNPGIYIDENKGTWILNPGGDLTSTQGTFEKDLQTLPGGWIGISSRAPSEAEFAKALGESEIMLYFGHGSGGQFIRARTVKKLDHCAVALLMGCSSGALKEAGEFQPYGMPLAYLLGGSHSVVANLWDVTDKDIDKFSKKVLEEWGLLRSSATVGKAKAKAAATPGRNRSKSQERQKSGDGGLFGSVAVKGKKVKMSLVEAVARGRKECHLTYLNGAAPVVYGVPVYLA
ncbi:hypothetical protein L211DRAFT_834580 [Terfezia boudieri ATCC MYA-4762]|uniref:separase n=1 Tax=Terfezia boudieri ATCC MYA-4762 TaxID=1051890 RepID=A0A3N4LXX5_9PEZI|nr:hypothetical protein L211DRAFT_834580 [Terfezia boudieri ATCC MYA-4762]